MTATILDLILSNDPLHQRIQTHLRQSAQARHASEHFRARLRGLLQPDAADRLREQIHHLQQQLAALESQAARQQ